MADPSLSVELRGPCPREIVDVLDAVSQAKRITRTELVNRVLASWVRERLHETTLVQRVTRGNPALADARWSDTE